MPHDQIVCKRKTFQTGRFSNRVFPSKLIMLGSNTFHMDQYAITFKYKEKPFLMVQVIHENKWRYFYPCLPYYYAHLAAHI